MKVKITNKPVRGFALIATISVLLLLTLVAVAFLSLSAITLQTSRTEWAQEEARANARLALKIAIGELQRDLGPDRRVAITGAVLDDNPDTLEIDGVAQPNWTGVMTTVFDGTQNGSPFVRDDNAGGLQDLRGGTDYEARTRVTNWLVSGNDGGRASARQGRDYSDALTEEIEADEDTVTLVGDGSVEDLNDFIIVNKVETESEIQLPNGQTQFRPNGGYGWWVTPENQKASVAKPDRHLDTPLTDDGEGIERVLHVQDAEVAVVEGISLGQVAKDQRILNPDTLALVDPENVDGLKDNFYALAGQTFSVLSNTRNGGLKKNLTAFLNSGNRNGPETIESLDGSQYYYTGIQISDTAPGPFDDGEDKGNDRLIGPPNEEIARLRGDEFTDSAYSHVAPTFELLWNWARYSETFNFGAARASIRPGRIWRGATGRANSPGKVTFTDPKFQPIFRGTPRGEIFDGENLQPIDPRWLSDFKITPVVAEAATYYNLATYPIGVGSAQRWALRVCIYPRISLWNPYNVDMVLSEDMIIQLFVNGKKRVSFNGMGEQWVREIGFGGRTRLFDHFFGGQISFTLPRLTIPAGQTVVFSMGNGPQELNLPIRTARSGSQNSLANVEIGNILQAERAPSSESYLFVDYDQEIDQIYLGQTAGVTVNDNRKRNTRGPTPQSVDTDRNRVTMSTAPTTFIEFPERSNNGTFSTEHGPDNNQFFLKYNQSGRTATYASFAEEPMLVYGSVALQAGGGDERPIGWAQNFQGTVHRLNSANDHLGPGVDPSPATRDGFRLRWLRETEDNRRATSDSSQILEDAPLGNWNLRAAYFCRSPFDNVTKQAPFFHGIYTRDNPSTEMRWSELTPLATGGLQLGFPFGQPRGPDGARVNRVIAFELPTQEVGIPSLGYLRHLQVSEYPWSPSYAIGNSIADPRVPLTGTLPTQNLGEHNGWNGDNLGFSYWAELIRNILFQITDDEYADNHVVFDMSYELNHNLWSDYFVTGATEDQVANFAQDPVNRPLKNGSLHLWNRDGGVENDLTDFYRAAGRLMIEGGFDVHSVNVEAWKAMLSSARDVGYGSPNRSPFPRTLFPKGDENDEARYSTKVFEGFRSLGDVEMQTFAEEMVRQVKLRAPFFGLSDFVNRRLADDETGEAGAIEAAIVSSLPNRGMNQNPVFSINQSQINAQSGPIDAVDENGRLVTQPTTTPMDQSLKPPSTGYGMPGYVTQGDVLQVLGSTLSSRSDTFKVRAYGESVDANGRVLAQAWCEAVVQRTPEPVNPDDTTGFNPRQVSADEVDFGRRFRTISFRWLARDEV